MLALPQPSQVDPLLSTKLLLSFQDGAQEPLLRQQNSRGVPLPHLVSNNPYFVIGQGKLPPDASSRSPWPGGQLARCLRVCSGRGPTAP